MCSRWDVRVRPERSRAHRRPPALPARAALGLPVVRRVAGAVARRAWIACLGYRRYRYEREHPRRLSPFESMPPREAVAIADACLNPVGFLGAE